jgi:hypothetical protein
MTEFIVGVVVGICIMLGAVGYALTKQDEWGPRF